MKEDIPYLQVPDDTVDWLLMQRLAIHDDDPDSTADANWHATAGSRLDWMGWLELKRLSVLWQRFSIGVTTRDTEERTKTSLKRTGIKGSDRKEQGHAQCSTVTRSSTPKSTASNTARNSAESNTTDTASNTSKSTSKKTSEDTTDSKLTPSSFPQLPNSSNISSKIHIHWNTLRIDKVLGHGSQIGSSVYSGHLEPLGACAIKVLSPNGSSSGRMQDLKTECRMMRRWLCDPGHPNVVICWAAVSVESMKKVLKAGNKRSLECATTEVRMRKSTVQTVTDLGMSRKSAESKMSLSNKSKSTSSSKSTASKLTELCKSTESLKSSKYIPNSATAAYFTRVPDCTSSSSATTAPHSYSLNEITCNDDILLVMELANHGSLRNILQNNQSAIKESNALLSMKQRLMLTLGVAQDMLAALAFLEGRGIVHNDLKPCNILVFSKHKNRENSSIRDTCSSTRDTCSTRDASIPRDTRRNRDTAVHHNSLYTATKRSSDVSHSKPSLCPRTFKLADFGSARLILDSNESIPSTSVATGSYLYMSPERLKTCNDTGGISSKNSGTNGDTDFKPYDSRSDVWSLGRNVA